MSNPTFKDIEVAARWVDHNLPSKRGNVELVEDLAFFVAATRYMERQRCADEVEKRGGSREISAAIRALGAGEPTP